MLCKCQGNNYVCGMSTSTAMFRPEVMSRWGMPSGSARVYCLNMLATYAAGTHEVVLE